MTDPRTSGTFEPNRPDSRPPSGLAIIIAMVVGIRKRPDCVTDEPKP